MRERRLLASSLDGTVESQLSAITVASRAPQLASIVERKRLGREAREGKVHRIAFRCEVVTRHRGLAGGVIEINVCATHTQEVHHGVRRFGSRW